MKRPGKSFVYALVTVAFAAGSVFTALKAYREIEFYRAQINARHGEREALNTLARKLESNSAAFEWLQQEARPGESLENLIKQHLPGIQTDLVLREMKQVGNGWSVKNYDMRLERVPAKGLSEFLVSCENARPPVRVTELQVSAQNADGEMVMAQLSLAEIIPADIVSNP